VKDGLPASSRRKKRQQLHEDCCHVGYMPDCLVCKTTKVSLRRIQNKVDPYIDTRPCARFHCDTGTVDCKTCDGERYFTVMREEGADYMEVFLSKYKSDIVKGIDRIITRRRNQPMFSQYKGYKFCSYLKLDPDALWREDAAEFKEVCERHGITVEYCDKNDHRTHGRAENAVRQMEMGIKCAMAQTGLPRWMWGYCAINTRNCKNWFPTRQAVKSQDGDAARPLEKGYPGGDIEENDRQADQPPDGMWNAVLLRGDQGQGKQHKQPQGEVGHLPTADRGHGHANILLP